MSIVCLLYVSGIACTLTKDRTLNLRMCPDQESNPQPFGYRTMLQPAESYQPGHEFLTLTQTFNFNLRHKRKYLCVGSDSWWTSCLINWMQWIHLSWVSGLLHRSLSTYLFYKRITQWTLPIDSDLARKVCK